MKTLITLLALVGLLAAIARAAEFDAVQIIPRQDWPSRIYDYRLDTSNDEKTWTPITTGTMADTGDEKNIAVAKQSARFVRIVALTADGPNGAAISEFNLTLAGNPLDRSEWQATADSEAPEAGLPYGPASYAIDGNPATCWHTAWPDNITPLPHTLTIDTAGVIHSDSITLAWDANPEPPTIKGYSIVYGQSPKQLDKLKMLGNVTEATLTGLTPGVWYFAARAISTAGVEGPLCSPVSYKFSSVVSSIPTPVQNLRRKTLVK